MGVVRDVTVDNLVTAVGNIDTSSLAQDSTLQDVVTAIGNISGGSDPVTNTTVNSLCKDTTGQSIASAISGLGATLGSDRALIDGSNIGDKATFRSNIGLVTDAHSETGTYNYSYAKYGNIVFVYIDTIASRAWTAYETLYIGTLPQGYRPTTNINWSAPATDRSINLRLNVTTQGYIQIYNAGGALSSLGLVTTCFSFVV